MTEDSTVQMLPVLSAETCAGVAQRVRELRSHWIKRDEKELYTLGAAAYLDAPDPLTLEGLGLPRRGNEAYYARAPELNALLLSHFSEQYEGILRTLSEALEAEVGYCQGCALPGFHIFGASPDYESPAAHLPHVDRQYRALDWKTSSEIDFSGAISFTLPIELPTGGGGLRVWDINLFDVEKWDKNEAKQKIAAAPSHPYAYSVGQMLVHRGHALHRIEPWTPQPGEYRMTVQGHGLYFDGRWNLYW